MTRRQLTVWGVISFLVLIVLANTFFVVDQRESAIVLRLGQLAALVEQILVRRRAGDRPHAMMVLLAPHPAGMADLGYLDDVMARRRDRLQGGGVGHGLQGPDRGGASIS